MSDDDPRLPAPRNSLGGPPGGVPRKGDGRPGMGRLKLVRLIWPGCVEVRPARLEWLAGDRRLVEWVRRVQMRRSWLSADDVRDAMRWGESCQVMVTLPEQDVAAIDVMVARGEVRSRADAVIALVARGLGR